MITNDGNNQADHAATMVDIHDSDNCHLGPNDLPCDMCVAAAEHEHKQRQHALKTLAKAGVFSGDEPPLLTDTDKAALLEDVLQRARDDLNDGRPLTEMAGSSRLSPVERRIAQAIEQDKQFASLSVVRAAVADVLDAGWPVTEEVCECGHDREMHDTTDAFGPAGHCKDWSDGCDSFTQQTALSWLFECVESEHQTEMRAAFIDAVQTRITELQSPPHDMDARLLRREEV